MTLALATSQSALAASSARTMFTLFHLTTYTDVTLGTVESDQYWSLRKFARYPWNGGVAREFRDVVTSVGPFVYSYQHLPSAGVSDLRRTAMRVTLSNENVDGVPLWQTLSALNLTFARLEIATLLASPSRLDPVSAWWNLTDLPGTEHVYRFRGELTSVELADDDQITLMFEALEPAIDWAAGTVAAEVDQRDLGKRYSVPYGKAKGVPVINRQVGWLTTLATQLSASQTGNADVASAVGLPTSGSFTLQLGTERVTASYVDADTVNIGARGIGGTTATPHQVGESILEVLTSGVVLVAAGIACKAVDALYVVNPVTRDLVKVTTAYSVNLADTTVDSGRTLTTVSFTQSQFQDLLDTLGAVNTDPFEEVSFNRFLVEAKVAAITDPADSDGQLNTDGLGIRLVGTNAFSEQGTWTVDAAAIPSALLSRPISRFRAVVKLNGQGDASDAGAGTAITRFRMYVRSTTNWLTGPIEILDATDHLFSAGTQENGVVVSSGWITPTLGTKLGSDLDELALYFYLRDAQGGATYDSGNWVFIFADSVKLEIEFDPAPQSTLGMVSFGWGLEFVADVQGAVVPSSYKTGYGFDEDTGWSVSGGAVQTGFGTYQRIAASLGLIGDAAGACEDSTLWTATNATLSDETTIITQGTKALKIDTTSGGSVAQAQRSLAAAEDWRGRYLVLDIRPDNSGHINANEGIRIRVQSSSGNNKRWDLGTDDGLIIGQYVQITIDLEGSADNTNGTLNLAAVNDLLITANGRTNSAANVAYVDNIRLRSKKAIAQRNATAASVDLTTGITTLYRTRVKVTGVSAVSTLVVRFSNTAGSGTTLPAAYRTITIQPSELVEGAWVNVDRTGGDTGSPSLNNIETVVVEINCNGSGLPTVDIDNLAGANATNADWDGATPGDLLESGADLLRYFIGEIAGLGAANVLGCATVDTNLGADVFAGDIASAGDDFGSVVARLAFETRTNVFRREESTGTQFELMSASAAYAFSSSVRTLSQLRDISEGRKPSLAVGTRWRWFYQILLAAAANRRSEDSFLAIVQANPTESDVTTSAVALANVEKLIGPRPQDTIYLLFSRDDVTAIDVAGYYVAEGIRTAARHWTASGSYAECYDLEPGDVITLPLRWSVSSAKARVVGTTIQPTEDLVGLVLEEVL